MLESSDDLSAARAGDDNAFANLIDPLRRELHVHCYRMLGTLHDADDALQETLLRAWRQIGQFEPRAPLRAWLYRIATNVCLTMLERRTRRGGDGSMHLHPYPDQLLDELAASSPGPETAIERDESVELAFITAVQYLPPRQRATLLLREVMGYPAADVAAMLETTVAGVNSALQRARATLAARRAANEIARTHDLPDTTAESELVRRLIDAWQSVDIPAIVAILAEDALFSMPPLPEHFVGREAIAAFLAAGPAGGRLDRFRLVPIRANRQPAIAAYWRQGDNGPFHAHGIMVLACTDGAIASLTRFGDADLFARFDLPLSYED